MVTISIAPWIRDRSWYPVAISALQAVWVMDSMVLAAVTANRDAISHRPPAPCGGKNKAQSDSTSSGADAAIQGRRRPQRLCVPSVNAPISGSVTTSQIRATMKITPIMPTLMPTCWA